MKLLLVYNANSGKLNAALDSLHKLVSPATYSCALCSLTHGNFQIRQNWKAFLGRTAIPIELIHKDEFQKDFPNTYRSFELPIILISQGEDLQVFLTAAEIAKLNDECELIKEIDSRWDQFQADR